MANRLADALSPYLRQHAENPVQWWPWSPEAFAEARRRDVPVLLSVGYAACHWCHVMAHESFEDSETAQVMNEHFVNIKVDREERPDVDAVYMQATQAMTGQGGWPMTCFLTPEGEPFHCGTYYPPRPLQGIPSFAQLLDAVVQAWTTRGSEVREAAAQVVQQLAEQDKPLPESPVDTETLDKAVSHLHAEFDAKHGGFGGAPKFPASMVLAFLLRHHERVGFQSGHSAWEMAEQTAAAMARGGIYDQLAGGFARYSVDTSWVVPHFEKMLYDNALLLSAYAQLARHGSNGSSSNSGSANGALFRRVVEDTAAFMLSELRTPEGGFAAALDADTEGVEGLTYVWTPPQLHDVLGSTDGQWAAETFGVTEEGTFEHGTSTLQLPQEPDDADRFARVRESLLRARRARPQPARDDKVITAWNGLAISGLVQAAITLQPEAPEDSEYVAAAVQTAHLLLDQHLSADRRLMRASRDGVAGQAAGVLEDYGCLADGLLALHQVTGEARWLEQACALLDLALELFADPDTPGAFHDTAHDAEQLVRRPSDPTDNVTPSGASALTSALLTASVLTGGERWQRYRQLAEQAVSRAGLLAQRVPRFAGHWLATAEALVAGPIQVAIAGKQGDSARELAAVARTNAPLGGVVVVGEPDAPGIPLLAERPLVSGQAAAYVCRGYICDRPVTSPNELRTALS